jgi:Domain of unknown function (DUF4272)
VADDEIEINPRPAQEAGRRLIVLASLIRRLFLEDESAHRELGDEANDERFDILAWLENNELADAIEPEERIVFGKPLGGLTPDDFWAISSQVQSVVVLGWYLNLIPDMPELDSPDLADDFLEAIPQPWDLVQPWLDALKVRSLEELAAQRELSEIWMWRGETEEERITANSRERTGINIAIRETAIEALNAGMVTNLADGDLAIGTRAFKSLDTDEQEAITLTSFHRLKALNWLCGYGESWSEVPLEI